MDRAADPGRKAVHLWMGLEGLVATDDQETRKMINGESA